jgi:transcriptional regulator with XRE-family HTH domain
MDRASITRIENGKRYLRDYEIRAITKILKVSAAWLFRETDSPTPAHRQSKAK